VDGPSLNCRANSPTPYGDSSVRRGYQRRALRCSHRPPWRAGNINDSLRRAMIEVEKPAQPLSASHVPARRGDAMSTFSSLSTLRPPTSPISSSP